MPQRRADIEVDKSSGQDLGAVRLSKGYVARFGGALLVEQNPVDGPCGPNRSLWSLANGTNLHNFAQADP